MHTHTLPLTDVQAHAVRCIDDAVVAMDALASALPDGVARKIKRTRGFATTTHLLEGVAFHHLMSKETLGVSLSQVKQPRGDAPPFLPIHFGSRGADVTAHAYLAKAETLRLAWIEADRAAAVAAEAWAQVPGMERTDLTLSVSPRPHLKGIRAAVNLAGMPIEAERNDTSDSAESKDWDAPDGPRQRLVQFLSMAALVHNATGVWGVAEVEDLTKDQANHRVRAAWGNKILMVDAASREDALTLARALRWVRGCVPFGLEDTTVLSAALFHSFEETTHG
jgi:hypothetical protein